MAAHNAITSIVALCVSALIAPAFGQKAWVDISQRKNLQVGTSTSFPTARVCPRAKERFCKAKPYTRRNAWRAMEQIWKEVLGRLWPAASAV